jgi:DNA-binding CsgD family transcriptional regulator
MLQGRARECAVVDRVVAGARERRSDALVVRGEAGVGKSALLDYAATADGVTVLRAGGVEAESELSYAALHQLLHPVLGHTARLPAPQAAALRGAFGLDDGKPDRFRVSLAVLSLLAEVAEERPLLCLVDDAQWLDRPSADALLFCARRLEAEGVVLMFAARDGEPRTFDAPGLAELRLAGLDADAAARLLAARGPAGLAPSVSAELVRLTGGNPLALAELPGALDPAQLAGPRPLPDPLPLTRAVEDAYLRRVRLLPPDTRELLEVAAAEDAGDIATVLAAAAALGSEPDALDAAERAGLVAVTAAGLQFPHPLVRSAIYGATTFSRRRAVHRALADVLDTDEQRDRRAWHRAAAALGTDAAAAEELEQAARRARARGGPAAAGAALARAADLTPDTETRAGRLIAAAFAFRDGGSPEPGARRRAHRRTQFRRTRPGRAGLGGRGAGPARGGPGPRGAGARARARPRVRPGRGNRDLGHRPHGAGCGPARGGTRGAAAARDARLGPAPRDHRAVRLRRRRRGGGACRAARGGRAAGRRVGRFAAGTGQHWASALVARCRAMLPDINPDGDPDRHFADAQFNEALHHHAAATRPFEHARTALLYGEHLRRQRRRTDARPPLRGASEIFERLGAQPWATRAHGELRATGETARRRDPSTVTQLTPQELQIARIVAGGATNREVAAQLFLSPRTVDYHLRKVFLKLGVSSRAELVRLSVDAR